ncbi:hypothetical protein Ancab_008705 [Ancistrocladus abbreviatus]
MGEEAKGAHVLIVPYPAQGHINPMLQFGKHLTTKGVKSTLATTVFIVKNTRPVSTTVQIETISDGFDQTGFAGAKSAEDYFEHLRIIGSKTLSQLIVRHSSSSNHPFNCVIYDAAMPWVLEVVKEHGLLGASFFSQPATANSIVYYVSRGMLPLPISSTLVSIPGVPFLRVEDLPSLIAKPTMYPAYVKSTLSKYTNVDRADFLLVNTVYELENKVLDGMSNRCPMLTIGPTIPFGYLSYQVEEDNAYGLNLFNQDKEISNWLKDKPDDSVVYVSFGSISSLGEEQTKEMAWGLRESCCYYVWVIRDSEQAELAKTVLHEKHEKGIIVNWCPQLEVLANEATGCFLTHCGWNSTLEAVSLGVRMVAMPQWADQPTNAALIQDIWKVGRRVSPDEKGIVRGYEIAACIRDVMHGERSKEMKANAKKLGHLIKAAASKDGSSAKNIDEFVSKIQKS